MLRKKIVGRVYSLFRLARANGGCGALGRVGGRGKILSQQSSLFGVRNAYHFSAVSIKDMKITYDPSKKT